MNIIKEYKNIGWRGTRQIKARSCTITKTMRWNWLNWNDQSHKWCTAIIHFHYETVCVCLLCMFLPHHQLHLAAHQSSFANVTELIIAAKCSEGPPLGPCLPSTTQQNKVEQSQKVQPAAPWNKQKTTKNGVLGVKSLKAGDRRTEVVGAATAWSMRKRLLSGRFAVTAGKLNRDRTCVRLFEVSNTNQRLLSSQNKTLLLEDDEQRLEWNGWLKSTITTRGTSAWKQNARPLRRWSKSEAFRVKVPPCFAVICFRCCLSASLLLPSSCWVVQWSKHNTTA